MENKKIAFLINQFCPKEKRLIKRFCNKHRIKRYLVYSLNKDDIRKGVEYLNVNEKFYKIHDVAFNLLDKKREEVDKTAEILSNIMGLDLAMFTKRLLLNEVFYKEAQFIVGEEILHW